MKKMAARIEAGDLAEADDATVEMLIEHGQSKLKAQMDLALSADRRAQILLTVSSAFASAAVTLLVASAQTNNVPVAFGAGLAVLGWIASAALAVSSMAPTDFSSPGWDPHWFAEDIRGGKPYGAMMREAVAFLDKSILENRALLKSNAGLTSLSMLSLFLSPFCGAMVSLILIASSPQ